MDHCLCGLFQLPLGNKRPQRESLPGFPEACIALLMHTVGALVAMAPCEALFIQRIRKRNWKELNRQSWDAGGHLLVSGHCAGINTCSESGVHAPLCDCHRVLLALETHGWAAVGPGRREDAVWMGLCRGWEGRLGKGAVFTVYCSVCAVGIPGLPRSPDQASRYCQAVGGKEEPLPHACHGGGGRGKGKVRRELLVCLWQVDETKLGPDKLDPTPAPSPGKSPVMKRSPVLSQPGDSLLQS